MEKKLYRVNEGKVIFGVCKGLSEYFNMDVTLVRVIAILLWATGAGFLAYIITGLILPVKEEAATVQQQNVQQNTAAQPQQTVVTPKEEPAAAQDNTNSTEAQ